MSLVMRVKESELGLVRLFAVDLPPRQAMDLKDTPEALAQMLGVKTLVDGQWELFDLTDLAGLGLESYLAEGHGIPEDELEPHRWTIDALDGVVFILRSAALADKPVQLMPRAPLRWIATFGEDRPAVPIRPDLPSASARGQLNTATTPASNPRSSWTLLVLALILTAALAATLILGIT